jgi:hypothetical protein
MIIRPLNVEPACILTLPRGRSAWHCRVVYSKFAEFHSNLPLRELFLANFVYNN